MLVGVLVRAEILRCGLDELVAAHALADPGGPALEARAQVGDLRLGLVDDAEVDQGEPLRPAALDLVEGRLPGLEVELGRRRGGEDGAARRDAHSGRVARVERSIGVEVADVVGGVTGRREALEAEHLGADCVDVRLGDGHQLAPEAVELFTVKPAGAALETLGVDEVRRADLGDVHLQLGLLADERAGRAGVVEVDVREQQVPQVAELEAALGESVLQLGDARRRPAVLQRKPVRGLDQVAADHLRASEVPEIEFRHGV